MLKLRKQMDDRDQVDDVAPDSAADEYLSKLANSILSKDKPKRPAPAPAPSRPASSPSREVPRPTASSTAVPRTSGSGEWQRQVDLRDENGQFLPGTILVFEDGSVGLYKEPNPAKEYDIVYMLRNSGRVSAQGIAVSNYDVEPIGRLSPAVFDSLVQNNAWERDMMVFHLLRYKDRTHIPEIVSQEQPPSRAETYSRHQVRKLETDETLFEEPEKPKLVRGRQLTIQFSPGQKWSAVYWGQDELGHVVAHHTHDKWALMHLDLDRFKDSMSFHEIVGDDVITKMQRDFTTA